METIGNEKLRVSLTRNSAAVHMIEDRNTGDVLNLVLPGEEDHLTDPSYAGNTVGAYSGRIGNSYMVIDGVTYHLDCNDRHASLHGGLHSLRRKWDLIEADDTHVVYGTRLSHLEDGLPGERFFRVRYEVFENELRVEIGAESDRSTYFNLTNHTYIRTEDDMRNARMRIDADRVVVNDREDIPEEVRDVEESIFDFRKERVVGKLDATGPLAFSRGLNNSYLLDGNIEIIGNRHKVAILTNAPTAVVYMGGYLDEPFSGIAVEPENDVLFSNTVEGMLHQDRRIVYRFD